MTAEPLARTDVAETLRYLAASPFENVYPHWLIASGRTMPGEVRVWRDETGAIGGVCYLGAQIVPVATDRRAVAAFGAIVRDERVVRTIAGSRNVVEPLWAALREHWRRPRLLRESQPLYALDRQPADDASDGWPLAAGRATAGDAAEIAEQSALMIASEIGGSPERLGPLFRRRIATAIDEGRWWRARLRGELAFICNVGSELEATAQISGVWSPVAMRGRGLARASLARIARGLLAEHRSLSLYVNDFNAPAIALYERLGFTRVGEFSSILF